MKKRLMYFMLPLLIVACNNKQRPETDTEHSLVPISFSIEGRADTKATDTRFEQGDEIGVFITEWSGSTPTPLKASGNYTENKRYSYNTTGFVSATPTYYPKSNKIDVYAYYPRVSTATAPVMDFSVQLDQSTPKGLTMSDFMLASKKGCASSTSSIPLTFDHALSKLKITINDPVIPDGNINIAIQFVYTSVKIDLTGQLHYQATSKNSIIPYRDPTSPSTFIVILPAQTLDAGNDRIALTISGRRYILRIPYDLVLEPGTETSCVAL